MSAARACEMRAARVGGLPRIAFAVDSVARGSGSCQADLQVCTIPDVPIRNDCYTGIDMACKPKGTAPAKKAPAKKSGK